MEEVRKTQQFRLNRIGSLLFILLVYSSTVLGSLPYDSAITTQGRSPQVYSDSLPYAKVVVYRPDNQLRRKYKIETNFSTPFELRRNEEFEIGALSGIFTIEVNASGHKKERFTFDLSPDKVHYFRIQDRNNYNGFIPYLEVIEVTEGTYKREKRPGLARK